MKRNQEVMHAFLAAYAYNRLIIMRDLDHLMGFSDSKLKFDNKTK